MRSTVVFYIESTVSIEDVKNKIRSMNNCSGNSSGEHRRYRYGVTALNSDIGIQGRFRLS